MAKKKKGFGLIKPFGISVALALLLIIPLTVRAVNRASSTRNADAKVVGQLPSDNLIVNPWFKVNGNESFDGWTDATGPEGKWTLSTKIDAPTPNSMIGTSARISTGRGDDMSGASVPVNYDAYLYQVVKADPAKTTLKFDMYWVAHTINPAEVTVYGSANPNGPWTKVWTPFYHVILEQLQPPAGQHAEWLWDYYSGTTDLAVTKLTKGYPYYKVEAHGKLPDEFGGFKFTGVYFAVSNDDPGNFPTLVPSPGDGRGNPNPGSGTKRLTPVPTVRK